jgi:NhaA family Na+:H+ antiporter
MATDGHSSADLRGGLALGAATVAALLIENSPLGPSYDALLHVTGEIRLGSIGLSQSLVHWINDGLMAIFFLLVGLEIKREAFAGPLASPRQAALPAIAALGGFLVPALIYAALNFSDPVALRGWAVPSATDIAFALGVCAMLGAAVPASLKTFLLALAIIDDLMAIVVIALFYTAELSGLALALAGLGVLALAALNRCGVRAVAPYLLAGVFTWVCVLQSGVHATLAGVAVGLAIPMTPHDGESLLERVEHALKPWVNYAIVPLFAFANAGVLFGGVALASLTAAIPLGIIAGLFVGKQLGVFLFAAAAVRLGIADRPERATALQFYGIALLTGLGFTMSLFIGTLAFEDEATMAQIRLGVLLGSLLSAVVACAVLLAAAGRAEKSLD